MANIILELQNSSNARSFKEENLIHHYEYKKVKGWIDEQLLMANNEEIDEIRLHETISVLGSRGSGKTSFLESLMSTYKDNKSTEVLKMIDPTLIEEKGHVFLDVISRINERVEEKFASLQNDNSIDGFNKQAEWDALVRKLADGLPLLDGLGGAMTEPSWQDAEFIMNKGIRAVSSARSLEYNFHILVVKALKILDRTAFVIIFDDIDIDFLKGWRVLETIRKYFTTPKIITVVSGDLRLYSLGIRKQQWKNFGKALLKNEGEAMNRMADFNDIVTVMEGQYMQKVMKSERRVHLVTLAEKLKIEGANFLHVSTTLNQTIPIEQKYFDILKHFGINSTFQANTYISFLLGLPLRTQIQFMKLFQEFDDINKLYPVNIMDPFLNDLYELRVDSSLVSSTPKLLNVIILKLLMDKKVLNDAYQLQPTMTDGSLNSCVTALSLSFAQASKKMPELFFDYFIKIGYTRNLLSTLNYREDALGAVNSQFSASIEGFIEHSGLRQDKVLRDIVGNMSAYIRGHLNTDKDNRLPWGGTILLPGLAANAKQQKRDLVDRIDSVFERSSLDEQTLAYIPLSICKYASKNATLLTYSVFGLVGTIGELLRNDVNVPAALGELSQIRTYTMPDFVRRVSADGEEGYNLDSYPGGYENDNGPGNLVWDIMRWKADFEKTGFVCTPYLAGKIVTRFFYALTNIQNAGNYGSLGQMFNDQITAFMNAVLIEESRESNDPNVRLNLNNTNLSDQIFINNLSYATKVGSAKFPLSKWLFSCPLLISYTKPELSKSIELFTAKSLLNFSYFNIYKQLCKVSSWGTSNENLIQQPNSQGNNFAGRYRELGNLNLPFSWFVEDNAMSSVEKNKNIRNSAKPVFGNEKISSSYLREFRRYLKKRNITSWSQKIS